MMVQWLRGQMMTGHSGSAQVSFELMDGRLMLGIVMLKMLPRFGLRQPDCSWCSTWSGSTERVVFRRREGLKTVKFEITVSHFTIPCVLSTKEVMVSLDYYLLSKWIAIILKKEVQS